MSFRNTSRGWGWPARLLHWATAAIVIFMFGLGIWMTDFTPDVYEQFALFQTHKSWGFVVFALALVRLGWRALNPTPEEPATMRPMERGFARFAHWALYALMLAMPLTGWLMASASELQDLYGIKNMVFGLFEMPDPFVPGSKALEEGLKAAHFWCGAALAAILLGHAAAALRHHFVLRDEILRRMIRGG